VVSFLVETYCSTKDKNFSTILDNHYSGCCQVPLSLVGSSDADLHKDSCRLIANKAILRDLERELKSRADDKNKDKETRRETEYVPADCEEFIVEHATDLGLASKEFPSGCRIWKSKETLSPDLYHNLTAYASDLEKHSQLVKDFKPIPDLLKSIIETGSHDVCKLPRPHPIGIRALFQSNQLSVCGMLVRRKMIHACG
jgi:hypothetical protein